MDKAQILSTTGYGLSAILGRLVFQRDKADTMKKGFSTRIAIKRMKGQAQKDIKIMHVGIIQGVVIETNKVVCAVDWVATDLDRSVDSNGCFKSVHGPVRT